MITLFLLGYIIPLVIMFSLCYFADDILTVRDLLGLWWTYLIPVLNICMISVVIIKNSIDYIESKIDKNWWNNFLDKRL